MSIAWGSLLTVAVVSFVAGVVVVGLVSLALVGLSARQRTIAGGPEDGAPTLSSGAGTCVAALCLVATVAIVAYGLSIVVA